MWPAQDTGEQQLLPVPHGAELQKRSPWSPSLMCSFQFFITDQYQPQDAGLNQPPLRARAIFLTQYKDNSGGKGARENLT